MAEVTFCEKLIKILNFLLSKIARAHFFFLSKLDRRHFSIRLQIPNPFRPPYSKSMCATKQAASVGFAKWSPIYAHKPETFLKPTPRGNRHLSNQIHPKQSKRGLLYRGNSLPPPGEQLFVPHYTLASARTAGYIELPPEPLTKQYTRGPLDAIARLSHGLDSALKQPGVHFVRDPVTGEYNFPPYVGTLHQPTEIDYNRMPPFVTSSKDAVRASLN